MRAARLVRPTSSFPLRVVTACPTLGAVGARRRRPRSDSSSALATIPTPTQVGGGDSGPGVRSACETARIPRARYGFDVVVVASASKPRRSPPTDARARPRPSGSSYPRSRSCCRSSDVVASPSARPPRYWLLGAADSFVDGRLVTFATSVFAAGMAASFLLGNLHDGVKARLGLAIVVSGAAIVDYNAPNHLAERSDLHPPSLRNPLARRLRASRAVGPGGVRRDASHRRRTRARDGDPHRNRRGARSHRARAPRRRRARGQRDGASGRRSPAQAARELGGEPRRTPGRRADWSHRTFRDASPPRRDAQRR